MNSKQSVFRWAVSVLTLVVLQIPPRAAPNAVGVEFFVSDGWGNPVRAALIRAISAGGPERILQYPERSRAELEPGSYRLVVEALGFRILTKTIEIVRGPVMVPLCLSIAPIEVAGRDRYPNLVGRVAKSLVGKQPSWVRLIAVYSEANMTAIIDTSGSFSFQAIQPGRYRLMLFSRGELKRDLPIEVLALNTSVAIE
jgi:hypothetical protein